MDDILDTPKQYSEEEIQKILNTAKATRKERDEVANKAKELESKVSELSKNLEQIKGIDPAKFKEYEQLAASYEERKLEEQRNFEELKQRWTGERTSFTQQIQELQSQLQNTQVVNALEKAFYSCGGRAGKDEDGYSYFDLIQERAKNYVQLDEKGRLVVLDPRDKTPMRDPKGNPYSVEDLMLKLRAGGPTAALFESDKGAGGGMQRSAQYNSVNATRESLMQMGNRAERLAKARELGIQ
ncbi:MAG: hypothetical protein KME29_04790 [Calothrix sp. FI2-JRJ7]|jgi:hypothetical protein|nr:hypothetical protein [Calothrix sp. FI2-JRJ7]